MFGHDIGKNAAAHVELGGQAHIAGLEGLDQVIEDAIGHGFMEMAFFAEAPCVELETFQLHAQLVGDIVQGQDGEVGLPGHGAKARKFRDFHVDMEIAMRGRIGEGLQRLGFDLGGAFGCHKKPVMKTEKARTAGLWHGIIMHRAKAPSRWASPKAADVLQPLVQLRPSLPRYLPCV